MELRAPYARGIMVSSLEWNRRFNQNEDGFQTATGKRVVNLGGRTVEGITEPGTGFKMR